MTDDDGGGWMGTPEIRIIRELWLTNKGGLEPGTQATARKYGRVFEALLIRELQRLAARLTECDIRFARGYVVEDYGEHQQDGIAEDTTGTVSPAGPRFDVVCYQHNVAWTSNASDAGDHTPFAVVPASYTYGVIEAKRTASPGYFPTDSSRQFNEQLQEQKAHLDQFTTDIPLLLVAAHYAGSPAENRRAAAADDVILLGDLSEKQSTVAMARDGALAKVLTLLLGEEHVNVEHITPEPDEKVGELQDIAQRMADDDQ